MGQKHQQSLILRKEMASEKAKVHKPNLILHPPFAWKIQTSEGSEKEKHNTTLVGTVMNSCIFQSLAKPNRTYPTKGWSRKGSFISPFKNWL